MLQGNNVYAMSGTADMFGKITFAKQLMTIRCTIFTWAW